MRNHSAPTLTKRLRPAAASLLLAVGSFGLTASATYSKGYYDQMEGKKKETLKQAAKACVQKHTRLDYYSLPANWQYTDIYPELVDGCQRWWEMYSDNIYLIRPGQSPNSSFSANKMQREHSVPKSWWKKSGDVEYTPAYTDLWNLYPSDGKANQAKSNYPFGVCSTASVYDNGLTRVGPPVSGQGGGAGLVFEPGDEYKGDFARTIFYMATVYDDLPWAINYMFNDNSTWPTLRSWAYETLLDWARRDPVSQKEIDRNDGVESQQGNRNPFIDFPELAEYIWGTRTTEVFRIAEQGGAVTPPITGDPEITSPISGEALDFGQAALGTTISRVLEIRGANLTQPLSLSVGGRDRKMFELETTQISANAINAAKVYRLQVFYTPDAVGEHQASIVIYDGGLPGGQSIAVSLLAEGCPYPELSRPLATEATEITETAYTANWQALPEVVDYYVVNRVRYYQEGEEGDLDEANGTSIRFEGRNPDVAESYSVAGMRLGVASEFSNTVIVAADNGVDTLNRLPGRTNLVVEDGRLRVVTNLEEVEVIVFDAAGRILLQARATDGQLLELPAATFLIGTATGMPRPLKLVNAD